MPTPSYPADAAFRALVQTADDALFVVDEWWRLQWANRHALQLLEHSRLPRDGGEFLGLFPGTTRDRIVLDGSVTVGGRWCAEGEVCTDELVAVDIVITGMEAGTPPGWRAVRLRDCRARRALETSLREAETLGGVGRLALALAHEFSELLTTITGSTELIASELAPRDTLRGDVESIRHAADRAAALTRELTRAASSRAAAPQATDVSRAVAAMDATMRRCVGERVRVTFDLPPDVGVSTVDVSQLEASLVHLARNARTAMASGGSLHVSVRAVECATPRRAIHSVMRPGRYVQIELRDTGPGMDSPTQSRCFEPLYSTWGGEGLGLSLVFGATTQMGGYVTCDSAPGRGSAISLYLPTSPTSPTTLGTTAAPPLPTTRSVLVVDDEESVRRVAARALRREGYRVSEAGNADEALSLVSQDPSLADVLVTDVMMPGLSGVELASCIVAARPDVRVLFSSGAAGLSAGEASRLPRGAAFLPKPFSSKALGDRVRALFGI
ncbi:MAG: response regulator [Gemmatimonadetes bacterium]|nr:response regulator [Gemmatimonadota bacterium]MCC6769573.1 response regulator [Gemmatimonadaceae bacterium]